MKILITGSKGMLASQIVLDLSRGYTDLGSLPQNMKNAQLVLRDMEDLDITDVSACFEFMQKEKPDRVINCAAYTNVDGCETHQEDAFKVNAIGAANLARACEATGAKLLHVSTDYVFKGDAATPRTEYDLPHPISVYGKTKLAGEEYVKQFCKKSFIVRTAWLYGQNGKNFVKTMLWLAKEKGGARVVNDQIGNPTNAADLSHHILKILDSENYGVYHCTGSGECSWYDFAREIAKLAGYEGCMSPCTTREYPTPTERPKYSSLDNMMLRVTVGDEMRPWKEALADYFEKMQSGENQ